MVEKKKALELKKHVATIHASNKLSLLQRKISNALLYNAYENLLEQEDHQIHIATLCKIIDYSSNDYKTIKRALVDLLSTVIEWNLVDGDKLATQGIWNASSIIASASIDGPICTYSYSNTMKKLLYHPEFYGRLNMQVQAKFQSSYGLALYENCIRFQNIEQTPWFDLAKFRKLMGVEEGKYKIFRDLKSRVIEKAVEEVNKYSPIFIEPQYRKQDRQVVAIQFLINKQNSKEKKSLVNSPIELSSILRDKFGFSKNQISEVIGTYDKDYILEKISVVESSSSFVSGKIGNLAKYLMSALKEDYQATKRSGNVIQIDKVESDKLKRDELTKKEQYRKYQNDELFKQFDSLSDKDKKDIISDFEKEISKSVYQNIYMREGLANILIRDQLCGFIKRSKQNLLDLVPSYENFLNFNVITS